MVGELGHGRGAGAADHEMRRGQTLRQVGEERRQLDHDAGPRIALRAPARDPPAGIAAPGAGARAAALGSDSIASGTTWLNERRALAAAEHQRDRSPGPRRARDRASRAAPAPARARDCRPGARGGRRRRCGACGERGRDPRRAAQHQAVGLAQHGVLLVQHGRQAAQAGGDHGRHRGVAAEADDGRRADAAERPPGIEQAAAERRAAPSGGGPASRSGSPSGCSGSAGAPARPATAGRANR